MYVFFKWDNDRKTLGDDRWQKIWKRTLLEIRLVLRSQSFFGGLDFHFYFLNNFFFFWMWKLEITLQISSAYSVNEVREGFSKKRQIIQFWWIKGGWSTKVDKRKGSPQVDKNSLMLIFNHFADVDRWGEVQCLSTKSGWFAFL